MKRLTCLVLVLVVSCGDDDGDPPPSPSTYAVEVGCSPVTTWETPDTAIGATSMGLFVLKRDDGGTTSTPVEIAFTGPNADEFAIVPFGSCEAGNELAHGDLCVMRIGFTPTAAGERTATLTIGGTTVPLVGRASMPTGLTASITNAQFSAGALATPDRVEGRIVNHGATTVTVGTIAAAGEGLFFDASSSCTNPLTPGGACTFSIASGQALRGCATGTFTIPSSANAIEIPVLSRYFAAVSVGVSGGRIVSEPPGIDCSSSTEGPGCSHIFSEDEVTLTVEGDAGNHFNGWTPGRCGTSPTCTIPTVGHNPEGFLQPTRASATFADPDAKAIRVTFTGGGAGYVHPLGCTGSCTRWVGEGTHAVLRAIPASRFMGWSGACTGTGVICDLGPIVADRDVSFLIDREDRDLHNHPELTEFQLDTGAFAADGDLIVGGGPWIYRSAIDETRRWTKLYVPAGSRGSLVAIKTGPQNAVYVVYAQLSSLLIKLDGATGAVVWRRTLTGAGGSSSALAVMPDGRIAVVEDSAITVYTSDGAVSWTRAVPGATAVASASTGALAIATGGGTVARFDAAGNALTDWSLPGSIQYVQLAFDRQDGLVVHNSYWGYVTRLDPSTGTPTFNHALEASLSRRNGLAITTSGEYFLGRPHMTPTILGAILETRAGSGGSVSWTLDKEGKHPADTSAMPVIFGDVACDAANRCAVIGTSVGGWVQVFSTP